MEREGLELGDLVQVVWVVPSLVYLGENGSRKILLILVLVLCLNGCWMIVEVIVLIDWWWWTLNWAALWIYWSVWNTVWLCLAERHDHSLVRSRISSHSNCQGLSRIIISKTSSVHQLKASIASEAVPIELIPGSTEIAHWFAISSAAVVILAIWASKTFPGLVKARATRIGVVLLSWRDTLNWGERTPLVIARVWLPLLI